MVNILDSFFNLGNKATGGDPVQKAKFDYYLYWIVFLAFVSIGLNYYYSFFFKDSPLSTLLWGVVITIFCWFNYWGLVAFRGVYINMKEAMSNRIPPKIQNKNDIDEVMAGFSDSNKCKGVETQK